MPFTTLTDNIVRKEQYIHAINYYIHNTNYPVVFTENSGTDISDHFQSSITNKRLEILTFKGNKNKEKGKGFGEAEIIDYALSNSMIIASTDNKCAIIKITGRIIIENISESVSKRFFLQESDSIIVSYNSDFSFADSRFIIAPLTFFQSFLQHKDDINDYKNSFFENVLSNCIKQNTLYHYYPFFIEPQITGQSGSTGELYTPHNKTFQRRLNYFTYKMSQILYFDKYLSTHKYPLYKRTIYTLLSLLSKFAVRLTILLRNP